jgi:hypothetical protein
MTIFCTTKPPEQYTVTIDSYEVGLWQTYGSDPDLFNLMSRVAVEFFQYEGGIFEVIPVGRTAARLSKDETLIASLDFKFRSGLSLRDILRSTTPREMFDLLKGTKEVDQLPLLEFYRIREKDTRSQLVGGLLFSVYLRVLQYEKHYRGVQSKEGKVIKASFRSNLDSTEAAYLKEHSAALLKGYKRGFGL